MNNCPNCHTPIQPGAAFCDSCGASVSSIPAVPAGAVAAPMLGSSLVCPTCQTPIMAGEAFCGECGTNLAQAFAAPAVPAPPHAPAASTAVGTHICDQCGNILQPGSAFCDNCGTPVKSRTEAQPKPLQVGQSPQPATPPYQQQPVAAAPSWQQAAPATWPAAPAINPRLVIPATNAALSFPPGKSEVLIGREDPVSGHFPDVNLGPHGGEEGGVSRSHARLIIQGNQCYLEDLNSVNYTHVNKQRLHPGVRQPLNHGDELRLGRLVLLYYTQ